MGGLYKFKLDEILILIREVGMRDYIVDELLVIYYWLEKELFYLWVWLFRLIKFYVMILYLREFGEYKLETMY